MHVDVAGTVGLALGDQHCIILMRDGSVWSTSISLYSYSTTKQFGKNFAVVFPSGALTVDAGISYSMVLKKVATTAVNWATDPWSRRTC